ncbi:MAG: hypothetical protein ACOX8V_05100 [Thermoleophilia bacterium]|jgi:hypothetical protein
MACFIAPAAVAVITTVVQKVVKSKETAAATDRSQRPRKTTGKWTQKLRWLNTMLWGGVVLLALEHVWHGEVTPWPPFLTAIQTPGEVGPMLHEIATYGGAMIITIVIAWGILVGIAELAERRAKRSTLTEVGSEELERGF